MPLHFATGLAAVGLAASQAAPAQARPDAHICDLGWGPDVVVNTGPSRDDRYKVPEQFRSPRRSANVDRKAEGMCPTRALPLRRLTDEQESLFRFTSGFGQEMNSVVRSGDDWAAVWHTAVRRHGYAPALPRIEFGREMLLIATMGTRPTGGYRVVIDRALERQSDIQVFVRHIAPGPRCGTTAAITHPMDAVRLRRSDKPVTWIVRQELAHC